MLLVLALSANSCAQLVMHSLGNVGIGTETPNSPLRISGGANRITADLRQSSGQYGLRVVGYQHRNALTPKHHCFWL